VVIAECVACKNRRAIGPNEVAANSMPLCEKCYCIMVAVKAKSK